uniref:DUF4283 domain-containing protein n=1 Tax=Cannabis sativa TaxID=3483 RepID=A0A803Q312_CANSA
MAKKKRVGQKPVSAITVGNGDEENSLLIQDVVTKPEITEEFHDSSDNLVIESGVECCEAEKFVREVSNPVSWAEKVEQADFQTSARDLWSKFKSNQVPSPSSKLTYTEPIRVVDQLVAKLDLEEIEVEASYLKNVIVCIVLGANPPFKVFEGFVKRIWGNLGIEKVVRMH